jgi:hypothetical protein
LQLAISLDGGRTYRELLRQEYNFSPPGTTFEREEWVVAAEVLAPIRNFPLSAIKKSPLG